MLEIVKEGKTVDNHKLLSDYSVKGHISMTCECGWKGSRHTVSKDGHYMALCDGTTHLEDELAKAKQLLDKAQLDYGYVPLLAL